MALLSFESALQTLLAAAAPVAETETVELTAACGRVLAQDLRSPLAVPAFDNSAMDGYAVRAGDASAGARLRVSQRIAAGNTALPLEPGTAARIFTGAPLPAGADAVVMQEYCRAEGDEVIIDKPPQPEQYVRRAASEIAPGHVVLAAGRKLSTADVGLAASLGCATLGVRRRLQVAIFFTGSELLEPGQPLSPGKIYNSNRYVMRGLLEGFGAQVRDLGIVPDDLAATRAALRDAAAAADVILTSGGVSAGEEDHVKPAVEAEGELALWKIAAKPGKPVAFGRVGGATFIGLPGNPVSVWVGFVTLVLPYLMRRQGEHGGGLRRRRLRADFAWSTAHGRREFVRVRQNDNGGLDCHPNQDSGALSSAAWADGLADIPPHAEVRVGDEVDVLLLPDWA